MEEKVKTMTMRLFTGMMLVLTILVASAAADSGDRPVDMAKKASAKGSIELTCISGSIAIVGTDRSEIHITGTLGKDVKKLRFDVDGDNAEIEVEVEDGRGKKHVDSELKILVPKGSSLEIQTVSAPIEVSKVEGGQELQSVSGSISVENARDAIEVQTVSGGITVTGNVEEAEVQSVSGSIEISGVREGVEAATTSGSISLTNITAVSVECESVSGSITFQGDLKPDGNYEMSNFSGNIKMELPSDINAQFEISTFSGGIKSDFGGKSERESKYAPGESMNLTVGSGSADVSLETFSGNVYLEKS